MMTIDSDYPVTILSRLLSPLDTGSRDLSADEWDAVLIFAHRMKVVPLLFYMIQQKPLISPPEAVVERLRYEYLVNASRTLVFTQALEKILISFHAAGVAAIPLKGAYLAHTVYERPALRQMVDLDILVHWEQMDTAIRLLEGLGYIPVRKPVLDERYRAAYHHYPVFLHPSGVRVELHWTITHQYRLGDRAERILEMFWNSATFSGFLSTKAWVISPEYLILHSVIHQNIHHVYNNGIREFYDIQGIARKFRGTIDWKRLISLADQTGLHQSLILTLSLTDMITGSGLMEEIHNAGCITELSPESVRYALEEISREKKEKSVIAWLSFSCPSARIWVRTILLNTFISRELMAEKYGIRSDSSILWFYYLFRVCNLLVHEGPGLFRNFFRYRFLAGMVSRGEW